MPNVIMHFEIPADDVHRAKAFYERTFGWTIVPYPMPPGQEYFGVTAKKAGEDGINGGLMQRKMPGQPFTNYVTVESIDETVPLVQANGGTIVLPKQEIGGGMGWIAAFTDPENNLIGLHQAGPAAPQAAAAAPASKRAPRPRKAVKKTLTSARRPGNAKQAAKKSTASAARKPAEKSSKKAAKKRR